MTNDPILHSVGRAAGQWWNGAHTAFQGFQSSLGGTFSRIPQAFGKGQLALEKRLSQQNESSQVAERAILEAAHDLESWRKNPKWVDEKAILEVSVPDDALCSLKSTFKVGLPPLAVFDILSDPENKRVFKDIQEVRYRKVLEDYGERQIVEVEQAAIWRFLWLSGTLTVFVRVDQDRKALSLKYKLGKEGFMKRFEGSWYIEPLYIDADQGRDGGRVASLIHLEQTVVPALMPPPPIKWYVRGITSKSVETLLGDLQAEGKRLREGVTETKPTAEEMTEEDVVSEMQKSPMLHRYGRLPSRASGLSRRNHGKRWRRINLFSTDFGGAHDAQGVETEMPTGWQSF